MLKRIVSSKKVDERSGSDCRTQLTPAYSRFSKNRRNCTNKKVYGRVDIPKPLLTDAPITILEIRITGSDNEDTLANHLHPMVQRLFPFGNAVFQDYNCPIHTVRPLKERFKEHEEEYVTHIPWPYLYYVS
ncbi:hypothetical protein AVEN_193722-1 [Araneus ventricosus]|uniref:Uncharacterized protein n=1 Tax=Araneus ventricosus TaxID=182803 RepID=A0A4Y2P1S5_ARAVE|nr:hypothetical protein AVEN_193722-1 [Araneus ventricosus]